MNVSVTSCWLDHQRWPPQRNILLTCVKLIGSITVARIIQIFLLKMLALAELNWLPPKFATEFHRPLGSPEPSSASLILVKVEPARKWTPTELPSTMALPNVRTGAG